MDSDQARTRTERLSSMLFLAVLAHGIVILGITFAPVDLPDAGSLTALKVTLLVEQDERTRAEDVEWLAQRSAEGRGRSEDGLRPTSALAASQPLTQLGDPAGAELDDGTPREPVPSAEQLVTRAETSDPLPATFDAAMTPAPAPSRAAALLDNPAQETLAVEIDDRARLPETDNDDAAVASPATRESILAAYLDDWRRRVERIGTANFPQLPHVSDAGRPTLEVAIGADGHLEDIVVRHSSGSGALDQAALHILRIAAPFQPLPPEVRAEYDVLRFAYEWDFGSGDPSAARAERAAAH